MMRSRFRSVTARSRLDRMQITDRKPPKRESCIAGALVYYKVDRTYLTNEVGQYERAHDSKPYLVPAENASAAALAFVTHEHASLVGSITSLPGDKASATAEVDRRVYVLFIERADEAIQLRQ